MPRPPSRPTSVLSTSRRAHVRRSLCLGLGLVSVLSSARVQAATPQDQQLALAAAGAVKIVVRGQGWLHVGQPALLAAGLPANVDPAKLQLFADGVEQALLVTGDGDATFAAGDGLEFYGQGRDTLWTDARTYWLVVGTSAGARVPLQAPAAGAAPPTSYFQSERLVERKNYVSAILNGDATNFFGDGVAATLVTKALTTQHLDVAAAGAAVLRVSLQGATATSHLVDVTFNGQSVGTASLGQSASATFSLSVANVVEGANQVQLVSHGASDVSAIESLELSYPHLFAADADALAFTAPAATRVSVTGFSAPSVRVVDVTDPTRPIELVVTPTTVGTSTTARIDTPAGAGERTLIAFLAANVGAPAAVVADAPSSWAAAHDGELVIISHASFLGSLAPLVARRRQEGWTVQLVDVQDVYDERGGGDKSASAIKDFLQGARATWRVPPRFALLVGDASFDPRNFLGKGDFDFLPTKLIDTATMETASDDWFADADLNGVPEIAVGRMPVRTAAQADVVVAKTLAWLGAADLPHGGLFVTDVNDADIDFETPSTVSETKVADIMPIDRFRRSDAANTSAALLAKLDAGPFLVNYLGHGSVEIWDNLLTSAQASTLTNGQGSIYVVMNCLNGFFHDLYTTSLAESLLEAPQGGAVAVWASSTLSDFTPQPAYNQEFLMHLGRTSLGEAALDAKQAITDLETRRTWILFGDPTLLGKPQSPTQSDGGTDAAVTDGGVDEAGTFDAGTPETKADGAAEAGVDGGVAMDGATMDGATMDVVAAADAAATDATAMLDGAAATDGMAATDGAAKADATDGATDMKGKAPPSGDGCSCALDPSASHGAGGLALLALGFVAAARRRARPRRRARRGLLGLLTLALAWLAFAPSAHAAYTFRKSLTIDHTRVGTSGGATTLTNYPLLISMTDPNLADTGHGGNVQKPLGWDIAFKGADTTTCGGPSSCTLNYEFEKYDNTTGQIIAWVQIPGLKTAANTANTVIYLNYGDSTASASVQNVNGTWDTNFTSVWHLNQSPATTMTDSTSNANNGTGTALTSAAAEVGSGVTTNGTTSFMSFNSSLALNVAAGGSFTYSTWLNTSESYGSIISLRRASDGNPDLDLAVGYDGITDSATNLLLLVRDDTGAYVQTSGGVITGGWHLVTVTRSVSAVALYVDSTLQGTISDPGLGLTSDIRNLGREGYWVTVMSNGNADQQFLAATFDELRASNAARNLDWVTTDYKSQSAPGSTFMAGPQVSNTCGDGTVAGAEACDDSNILSGDGCSSACAVESGYTCSGTPSVCSTICGDGIRTGSEACDDSNLTNGDGCSSTCTIESAYHCTTASPSVCSLGLFDFYKTVTVNKSQVGTMTGATTLSNYPVLVSVTDSSLKNIAQAGGHVRDLNGYDIIFQGTDTVTCNGKQYCQLQHEIEKYDSTMGILIAWVNVPVLNTAANGGASTSFKLLFGNKVITTPSSVATSAWDSTFTGVWHLNQTTSMTDSTSNANTGTGTALTSATGMVGSGVTTGTTSYLSLGSGTSLNVASGGSFSYQAWLNTSDVLGSILSLRNPSIDNADVDIMVGYDGVSTSSGQVLAYVRDDSGSGAEVIGPAITGAWHLVTVTRTASLVSLYVDAALIMTAPATTGSITSTLRDLGREERWTTPTYSTDQQYLAATFDELRASNTARNLDWITTDYNAQSSPGSFVSLGADVVTNSSTGVSLASFDASASCAGTTVSWETAYEIDTLGFNVYRDAGSARIKLNATLVAGAGLTGGGSHRYEILDPGPFDGAPAYELETVHLNLGSTWDGPADAHGGCVSVATTASSTSLGTPSGATATPLAATTPGTANEASHSDAAPSLGGCALGGRGAGGPAVLALASAFLALARRRRRR